MNNCQDDESGKQRPKVAASSSGDSEHLPISKRNNLEFIQLRSKRLTLSLFCLIGSISCLSPFLSLHLTNRIGLLLFESKTLQLRSSLLSVIIIFISLVLLGILFLLINTRSSLFTNRGIKRTNKSRYGMQKLLRISSATFGLISILAYMSLALLVNHIKQVQRMPLATFDCQANEIFIENCPQQFATSNLFAESSSGDILLPPTMSPLKSIKQLLVGDLNGNNERLIKRLDCVRYNHRDLRALRVPTKFLLHKCGLVCKPHRQQVHQFSDDLNSEQVSIGSNEQQLIATRRPLVAPYSHDASGELYEGNSETYLSSNNNNNLVTLKICFSGELDGLAASGRGSNYKKFCIENLTSESRLDLTESSSSSSSSSSAAAAAGAQQGQINSMHHQSNASTVGGGDTMTVGQLNAILGRLTSPPMPTSLGRATLTSTTSQDHLSTLDSNLNQIDAAAPAGASTHYVNPIVQFESHFKNWPHLINNWPDRKVPNSPGGGDHQAYDQNKWQQTNKLTGGSGFEHEENNNSWCRFKPIPPFIVNNKPFSDIQCSLEHEYLIRTAQGSHLTPGNDRIYLRKSTLDGNGGQKDESIYHRASSTTKERCSIQCKVNILYRVNLMEKDNNNNEGENNFSNRSKQQVFEGTNEQSFYLPLKPCLLLTSPGDKASTAKQYLIYRCIADSSLILAFILIDLLLLIESIETNQFHLEGKKFRLFSLGIAMGLLPILAALMFDITASWLPNFFLNHNNGQDNYFINLINEQIIPTLSELLSSLYNTFITGKSATKPLHGDGNNNGEQTKTTTSNYKQQEYTLVMDHYLIPFLIYALLMFIFVLSIIKLPLVELNHARLSLRAASTEELGLITTTSISSLTKKNSPSSTMVKVLDDNQMRGPKLNKISEDASRMQVMRDKFRQKTSKKFRIPKRNDGNFRGRKHLVLFAMLTLFMGLQLNLNQVSQSQILIESFDLNHELKLQEMASKSIQSGGGGHTTSAAFWFVLATQSSGSLLILLVAILFSDEVSSFLADFFPFKTKYYPLNSKLDEATKFQESRRNECKFKLYLSISLIIYALRYFMLANLIQANSLKWPLILLIQTTELLNFPLTWFVLSSRAHELLLEYPKFSSRLQQAISETNGSKSRLTKRLLYIHLLIQCLLAFIYFVLARFLALFLHTLHASLHLHSDNIDWFIETFYKENLSINNKTTHKSTTYNSTTTSTINRIINQTSSISSDNTQKYHEQQQQQQQQQQQPAALFAPLPSEKQTYLHASRLFIKYNSLACLLLGFILLITYFYLKYNIWLDAKRQAERLERKRAQEQAASSELKLIDERLGIDLHQMAPHRASKLGDQLTTMAHVPLGQQVATSKKKNDADDAGDKPETTTRARIHFRYELAKRRPAHKRRRDAGLEDTSSRSSSSSSSSVSVTTRLANRNHIPPPPAQFGSVNYESSTSESLTPRRPTKSAATAASNRCQVKIPVVLEEKEEEKEEDCGDDNELERRQVLSTSKRTLIKRVRLVEDAEDWSLGEKDEKEQHDDAPVATTTTTTTTTRVVMSPPPAGFDDGHEAYKNNLLENTNRRAAAAATSTMTAAMFEGQQHQAAHQLGRRISFAPTATLIDHAGGATTTRATAPSASSSSASFDERAKGSSSSTSSTARRASPEPSIDDDDDDDDGGGDGHKFSASSSSSKAFQVTAGQSERKLYLGEADSIENASCYY